MEISRVFDLLPYNITTHHKDDMLVGNYAGVWKKYAAAEVNETIDLVSRGLIALGIGKDDKVAIMSPNRPEWNLCDFGIMQTGAVQVPMYPTLSDVDIEFILKDAGIKLIFVADAEIFHKIEQVKAHSGLNIDVYTFDDVEGAKSWTEVTNLGSKSSTIDLEQYKAAVTADDLLTLIYTSGTTGTPKGVMLTHNNLLSNVIASSKLYPKEINRALSFLPMSHIFERMVIYMYVYLGISVYYAQSMDTIVADMQTVKPHCFTTVPRLLEKVYDRIVAKGNELQGVKKRIFVWALKIGLHYELDGKNGLLYELQLKVARKLVFSKWIEALGGEIIAIVSGGAALQPRLAKVFWGAGIKVLEGYGLTETSPVIAVNFPGVGGTRFGSVGPVLENVTLKLAEDGEILVKGPSIMKGYYKREDATSEVFDNEGFFHTGDIGVLLDGKYLCITDRKKEIFKTAGGKYIAPQTIENKFKESRFIEQIIVIGENQRFPAALIIPAFDALKDWCAKRGIEYSTNQKAIQNPQIIEKFQQEIEHYNAGFGHWEQIKKFELIADEWSIASGEMTPKLSLKRKVILKKYDKLVEHIYQTVN